MAPRRPDCTGWRFGMLTVLGRGELVPQKNGKNKQRWDLECECGNRLSLYRHEFERPKGNHRTSCGCNPNCGRKPDITGQQFGHLKVLGRGELVRGPSKSRRLWILECLRCGSIVKRTRGNLERRNGNKSCGCLLRDRQKTFGRKPQDITGQRFGALVVKHLTGKKDKWGKPTWSLQCDCGGSAEMSHSRLDLGFSLHCGDRSKHQMWLHYPPTPAPYPDDASAIVIKHLRLTQFGNHGDSALEDLKCDVLLRQSWIIAYRRQQGEDISELREKRIINKALRYCKVTLFWQRKLERNGGILYTRNGIKKLKGIGNVMTDLTSPEQVVSTQGKTQPETAFVCAQERSVKKRRFRRC